MEPMELRQYGRIVWKRWWLVAGLVLIACSIAAWYSFYLVKPVYEATTKLIVNKSDPEAGNVHQEINVSQISANILLINTYKEIIRSAAVMDKVVESYPEMNLTSEQLVNKVKVNSFKDAQIMILSVLDPDYERAMMIVNAVTDVFRESVREIMHVDNVTVLEYARPMAYPRMIATNPVLNLFVAFVFSFIVSVFICFFVEYLDDTVKDPDDISKLLNLPTLTIVTQITKQDIRSRKYRRVPEQVKEAPYATVNQ